MSADKKSSNVTELPTRSLPGLVPVMPRTEYRSRFLKQVKGMIRLTQRLIETERRLVEIENKLETGIPMTARERAWLDRTSRHLVGLSMRERVTGRRGK